MLGQQLVPEQVLLVAGTYRNEWHTHCGSTRL
jgi:hypothetical protein